MVDIWQYAPISAATFFTGWKERDGEKMIQRKETTVKIPIAPGILKEVKLDYQRMIRAAVQQYKLPDDLIINFDQTPLSYVCSHDQTFQIFILSFNLDVL